MSEPVTCRVCGEADPPPDMTCVTESGFRDHFVGVERGCPHCGRCMLACARRPCSVMREQSYEEGWDSDE